jgi:transposase
MPRLNNKERNQAIGMLNAGMSATGVSKQSGRTRKTIERFRRRFHVAGIVVDRPRNVRPRVTTAARYIVFQYLCNRCLTTAATGRQYGSSTE